MDLNEGDVQQTDREKLKKFSEESGYQGSVSTPSVLMAIKHHVIYTVTGRLFLSHKKMYCVVLSLNLVVSYLPGNPMC